jgi:hypothetical protein
MSLIVPATTRSNPDHPQTDRIDVAFGYVEVCRNPDRHDLGLAVMGHVRRVGTHRPGTRADGIKHRIVAARHIGCAGEIGDLVSRHRTVRVVAHVIWHLYLAMAVRQQEGLGRRQEQPVIPVERARLVGFQRIALAAVFLTKVEKQKREEHPERI